MGALEALFILIVGDSIGVFGYFSYNRELTDDIFSSSIEELIYYNFFVSSFSSSFAGISYVIETDLAIFNYDDYILGVQYINLFITHYRIK